jgi:lipopolysaccharide export system protein LptA
MFSFPLSVLRRSPFRLAWLLPATLIGAIATANFSTVARGQNSDGGALTVRSDIQEANSETGVVTARGNVQVNYPARQLQATAAQAQYFSRERRLVLTGNVYVLQKGNSTRAETMTYLVDEGRLIATPKSERQVESIYIIPESENTGQTTASQSQPSQPAPPQIPQFNSPPTFPAPVNSP